jgi:hypothetical protein
METSNRSFWELISRFKINIPIIQRDYAQGREEELERREDFLDSLHSTLTSGEPLNLDFVYGRVRDDVFFPIDGQQRLTTLFLLHWYVSLTDRVEYKDKTVLDKFAYDTRISSREFCNSLVNEELVAPSEPGENNFILSIKDQYWFRKSWDKDPTVKAMLVMIQAIHDKFYLNPKLEIWNRLVDERLITFEVLDLGEKGFELTDELYIKMNARGKQLTPFENFKANFIQFLEKNFKGKTLEHPIKGQTSYARYFSYKIEKEWTDLFWAYRGDRTTIDVNFTNYVDFVSQMCLFVGNRNAKASDFKPGNAKQKKEVFREEKNLLFLFRSLDKLYEIFVKNAGGRKNIEYFFETFITTQSMQNGTTNGINLFWNTTGGSDLFERVIDGFSKEDARNKIMLYCSLHYLINHELSDVNPGFLKYVRLLRNLIQAKRQRNDTRYNTDIRINDFGSYWLLFKQLATDDPYNTLLNGSISNKDSQISDTSLENEKEKINLILNNLQKDEILKLEELDFFGGLIHLLKPKTNHNKFAYFLSALTEIWSDSVSNSLRIKALISCGFSGLYIKDTKMGETYYFGMKENWTTILTSDDHEISKNIIQLLESFQTQNDGTTAMTLEAIANNWFSTNPNNRSWKYYFLKYSEFTSKLKYYVFPNDYEIRILGSESSNPLLAYHINPYVMTVCKKIEDITICDERDCYLQYSGHSPLTLKNGIYMSPTKNGWRISNHSAIIDSNIVSKYGLVQEEDDYLLPESINKDKVEVAVEFIKGLRLKANG